MGVWIYLSGARCASYVIASATLVSRLLSMRHGIVSLVPRIVSAVLGLVFWVSGLVMLVVEWPLCELSFENPQATSRNYVCSQQFVGPEKNKED